MRYTKENMVRVAVRHYMEEHADKEEYELLWDAIKEIDSKEQ